MPNPFAQKLPFDLNMLPSRKKIINAIAELIQQNQGVLIISEPRMASSSLIAYLSSPDNRNSLFGSSRRKLLFSLVNCQMLPKPFSESMFWNLAFQSFSESNAIEVGDPILPLLETNYMTSNDYFATRNILEKITSMGYHPVFVLKEIDSLSTDLENTSGFFSILRVFVQEFGISFILLSYRSHYAEYKIGPFANVLFSFSVSSLSNRDVAIMLNQENVPFSNSDRLFISSVAGGHPYLLRVVSAAMWDELRRNTDKKSRYLNAGKIVYEETQSHFTEIWNIWELEKRKAVSAIALIQTPYVLKNHTFSTSSFVKELTKFTPELRELKTFGYIEEDMNIPGGYKLTEGAMIWWLADELLRTIRDTQSFREWILDKELVGGLMKKSEIDQLHKMAKAVGGLISEGAISLIKAYAENSIK